MNSLTRALAGALVLALSAAGLHAQDGQLPRPVQALRENQSLQVQIVISRYQKEKRVSSLPFSLSVASFPGSKANVRMGTDVCVQQGGGGCQFRTLGTNIDVSTVQGIDTRLGLVITISESTLEPSESGAGPAPHSYQSSNTVFVKDGEMAQFTAATDRITGEVVRVEVTLKVLK